MEVPNYHFGFFIWVFPKIKAPQNVWFIRENPIKIDDLGVPLFLETPIYTYITVLPMGEIPTVSPGWFRRPTQDASCWKAGHWSERLRSWVLPVDIKEVISNYRSMKVQGNDLVLIKFLIICIIFSLEVSYEFAKFHWPISHRDTPPTCSLLEPQELPKLRLFVQGT